jgi:hypothetical protein
MRGQATTPRTQRLSTGELAQCLYILDETALETSRADINADALT